MDAEVLKVLKSRRRVLRSAVKANEKILSRLSHKSRRVRMGSMAGPRKNFFLDRLQELEITIEFLEGKRTKKEYLDSQVNQRL